MSKQLNVGLIGCGNISNQYIKGIRMFHNLNLVAVGDLNEDAAEAKAAENETTASTIDALYANPDIDILVNLTVPTAHTAVNLNILNAGKHLYCEKPFATEVEDAKRVIELAEKKGLSAGSAPDTFLGAGHQTARKVIDDGWIGRPVAGTAFFMGMGPESWHPNPAFFYQKGGGPMFDVGVYPITALINLLGPIKRVAAIATAARKERMATCKEHFGEMLQVEVPTHYAGTLEFDCGAVITLCVSFDVHRNKHTRIEIYGVDGSLEAPDPNGFDGPVNVFRPGGEWQEVPHSHVKGYCRGLGVADLAQSILDGRPQRASATMALHVLEVMHAFEKSSETDQIITIESSCSQPDALPLGLAKGLLG